MNRKNTVNNKQSLDTLISVIEQSTRAKVPTSIRQKMEKAVAANSDAPQGTVNIVRDGDKIILPDGMSYDEAHTWLERQEQAEESTVRIMEHIPCFPLDGAVQVRRAMEETFGFVTANTRGFFGDKQPPIMQQVRLADGTTEQTMYGEIRPPKWEDGHMQVVFSDLAIVIRGELKKKYEPDARRVIDIVRTNLRERSIYKGQAVKVDLSFMLDDEDREFDVNRDSPVFINTDGNEKLILNEETEFDLETSVFLMLQRKAACEANGIVCKHGVLLKGQYGTGKTLTARTVAQVARANGWTFLYLAAADQLTAGLDIAKMYAPSVVFVEDVDTAVGDRDDEMNELLNTLDGIDTKSTPVITIMTTNNPETIHPAFLRAGRIDTIVQFNPPTGPTAWRIVESVAGDVLRGDVDGSAVGKALAGLVPAFIAEAVNKAKRAAILRHGKHINGCVTTEDLLRAAQAVRAHSELLVPPTKDSRDVILEALAVVNNHQNGTGETLEEVRQKVRNIEQRIC